MNAASDAPGGEARRGAQVALGAALGVALLTAVVYLPSIGGAFQFDDYRVIVDYPPVHTWAALAAHLGAGVRPLLKASYALDWTLGARAAGFHAANVALHALNAALVYALGLRLCARWRGEAEATRLRGAALAAALLFALHPLQTEAVTYVSGRSVSLMASFYLGALLAYLHGRSRLSAVLFVGALATRETAVTLPAVLLLAELCGPARAGWRTVAARQAAHWALLAAAGLVFLLVPRYAELLSYGYTQRDVFGNLRAQAGGVAYLLAGLIGLRGPNIDPALPVPAVWDATLALQAAALAALALIGVLNLRGRPWIAFGLLWFFVQLAPTNSVVPRLDVANDRQLYLAAWGLYLALAVQIARLAAPLWPLRWPLRAAVAALCVAAAAASVARQLDYRSEIGLWEASVRAAPWNPRAHNNLGYAYFLAGRRSDARREFRAALVFDPGDRKARVNLLLLD